MADNQTTAADTMIDLDLGSLQVSCADQNDNAGIENATTRITRHEQLGRPDEPVPLGRERRARDRRRSRTAPPTRSASRRQNTFSIQLQGTDNKTVLVEGTARQLGQGTNDSSCAVFATAILVD